MAEHIDRKLFIPKEVHKIKLRKGETLVWALDFEQYRNLSKEKTEEIMQVIREGLKRQFPKNNVIVTIGKTEISTVLEEPPGE